MTTTETETRQAAQFLLVVALSSGETMHARAGSDAESARSELVAMQRRLESETFVRIGDDTIVRSQEVRSVQLHEDEPGFIDTIKDRIGGKHMSSYDTEHDDRQTATYAAPAPAGARRHNREEPGVVDQYFGYGRRPWTETKPFFLTSEFLAFVLGVAGVLIAAGLADNFDAPRAWVVVGVITAAYILSRGIAKAGTREPNPQHFAGPRG
ncbi:MAG: hypothetical protein ABR583_02865 [Gaiellaceae bacterium]